jgi:hypothetical protein
MTTTAITEAITTLAEAERRFLLQRVENASFFPEWQSTDPDLTTAEQTALDDLRRRYLYHRTEGHLLEGTVTLLLASPLLTLAGFYDPPFKIRSEESVQLTLNDGQETLQGRIDVLVLQDQLWVVVVESKKSMLSVWTALPQTLAYLMANPNLDRPCFGLLTNGDELLFVKLTKTNPPQYDVSRVFAVLSARQELHRVFQILKHLGYFFTLKADSEIA